MLKSIDISKEIFSAEMKTWKEFLKENGYKQRKPFYVTLLIVDIVLRGISQVYLADHPITGIFILVGLGCTSVELAVHAILGSFFSTIGCIILTSPQEADIFAGLCGYDGALVGCACWILLTPGSSYGNAILLSICAGMVHTGCKHLLGFANLPPFTLAFNIVMTLYVAAHNGDLMGYRFLDNPPAVYSEEFNTMSIGYVIDGTFRGVGQFMFASTTVGSVILVLGIGISSRYAAMASVLGAFVGMIGTRYILKCSPDA